MRKKISQTDAISYRTRAERAEKELRDQRNRWVSEFRRGWVNIESLVLTDASFAKIDIARRLGHAVIMVPGSRVNEVLIYADPLP